MSGRLVQIMAKAPIAGHVKTRLIPSLGSTGACELYRAMLDDCIAISRDAGAEVRLVVPSGADADTLMAMGFEVPVMVQHGNGLAEALAGALRDGLALGFDRVAVFGSDHPDVPAAILREAFDRLTVDDVVIGPTPDGGYYLLASRTAVDSLFQVQMSTRSVLDQTINAANLNGYRTSLVPAWQDVDTPEDVIALWQRLETTDFAIAPATRAALRSIVPVTPVSAARPA